MKLKDKVCVVTGAASGIGKEIALIYAREGGKIVIADLNLKRPRPPPTSSRPPAARRWRSP